MAVVICAKVCACATAIRVMGTLVVRPVHHASLAIGAKAVTACALVEQIFRAQELAEASANGIVGIARVCWDTLVCSARLRAPAAWEILAMVTEFAINLAAHASTTTSEGFGSVVHVASAWKGTVERHVPHAAHGIPLRTKSVQDQAHVTMDTVSAIWVFVESRANSLLTAQLALVSGAAHVNLIVPIEGLECALLTGPATTDHGEVGFVSVKQVTLVMIVETSAQAEFQVLAFSQERVCPQQSAFVISECGDSPARMNALVVESVRALGTESVQGQGSVCVSTATALSTAVLYVRAALRPRATCMARAFRATQAACVIVPRVECGRESAVHHV